MLIFVAFCTLCPSVICLWCYLLNYGWSCSQASVGTGRFCLAHAKPIPWMPAENATMVFLLKGWANFLRRFGKTQWNTWNKLTFPLRSMVFRSCTACARQHCSVKREQEHNHVTIPVTWEHHKILVGARFFRFRFATGTANVVCFPENHICIFHRSDWNKGFCTIALPPWKVQTPFNKFHQMLTKCFNFVIFSNFRCEKKKKKIKKLKKALINSQKRFSPPPQHFFLTQMFLHFTPHCDAWSHAVEHAKFLLGGGTRDWGESRHNLLLVIRLAVTTQHNPHPTLWYRVCHRCKALRAIWNSGGYLLHGWIYSFGSGWGGGSHQIQRVLSLTFLHGCTALDLGWGRE